MNMTGELSSVTDGSSDQGGQDIAELNWNASSYSAANGNCVELANTNDGHIEVRDSKNPDGPHLRFTAEALATFISNQKG
jgi:hypothetical protein